MEHTFIAPLKRCDISPDDYNTKPFTIVFLVFKCFHGIFGALNRFPFLHLQFSHMPWQTQSLFLYVAHNFISHSIPSVKICLNQNIKCHHLELSLHFYPSHNQMPMLQLFPNSNVSSSLNLFPCCIKNPASITWPGLIKRPAEPSNSSPFAPTASSTLLIAFYHHHH